MMVDRFNMVETSHGKYTHFRFCKVAIGLYLHMFHIDFNITNGFKRHKNYDRIYTFSSGKQSVGWGVFRFVRIPRSRVKLVPALIELEHCNKIALRSHRSSF